MSIKRNFSQQDVEENQRMLKEEKRDPRPQWHQADIKEHFFGGSLSKSAMDELARSVRQADDADKIKRVREQQRSQVMPDIGRRKQ